jgi:enoyl-CoA hydratase/carnithine racemase
VDVPGLAAVEGYALAGGFELMMACDVAIVRDDARIADHHATVGMVPGGGSSQRLPRLVGRQRALGLLLTGDRLIGVVAVAWGLAYRSAPAAAFDAAVDALALQLAGRSPAAARRTKRLVRDGVDGPLADGLDRELEVALDHLGEPKALQGFAR